MSRTRKDARNQGTVLEVVKRDDGKFDLFLNHKLDHGQVLESSLEDWLCVRFGYCGEEYDSILREVNLNGQVKVAF
jgi:hypothetical protein